jgi:TonB-dependent SusC/RagA subfamily outer membrane receptor
LSQDGTVGAGPVVVMRGYSGGATVSRPLLFIDGIRVDNSGGTATDIGPTALHPATGRFDDLDPADIARIEVLSGPAAATLYGPGAGNGVILVTTTRHSGTPLGGNVMVEGGVATTSVDAPQSYFSWGHAPGKGEGQCPLAAQAEALCTLDSISHFNPLTGSGTSPLIPAYTQRYGGNVGATLAGQQISISGQYANEPGTLELPPSDRAAYRSDLGVQPTGAQIRPSFFEQGQLHGSYVSHVGSTAQVVLSGGFADTHQRDGAIDSFLSDAALGSGSRDLYDGWAGPLNRPAFDLADVSTDDDQHYYWSLRPEWRWFHLQLGTDAVSRGVTDRSLNPAAGGPDTLFAVDGQRLTQYTADLGGTYAATVLPSLESRSTAGLQYLAANASDTSLYAESSNGPRPLNNVTLREADLTQSVYADEALAIANIVSVDGRVRFDHHRLQTGRVSSSAADPGVSASWAVLGTNADPRVRLRAALGETSTPVGATELLALSIPLQYMDLPFEPATRQREVEAGIDASLPGDRASLSLTTYAKRSVHAVLPFSFTDNVGDAVRAAEQGTVSDRGIEFSANARLIERSAVAWDATLTAFEHDNKVLSIPAAETWYDGMIRVEPDYPIYGVWAYTYTYTDANHNGVIEPGEVTIGPTRYVGPGAPTREASLASTVHLLARRLHVGVLFDYRGGYVLPDQPSLYQSLAETTPAQNLAGSSLRAQALATAALLTNGWPMGYADRVSALRWRELSVTTALPVPRPIQVTLAVRNLALWTTYRGDPDIALGEQPPSIASIAPTLQMPQPRTWMLRVASSF